nr:putative ribonuclease H-like domain-containing protein [Tanacetum cinerariifolium]
MVSDVLGSISSSWAITVMTNIYVDNESEICVVKNPVYHSKTKDIESRHHFIRDVYEKRLIEMVKIRIDSDVATLLTKAFDTNIQVDNESEIYVVKNPVYHSKTKDIESRHHFIRDVYEKRLIEMVKIRTNSDVANLLTKAFDVTSQPPGFVDPEFPDRVYKVEKALYDLHQAPRACPRKKVSSHMELI